METEHSGAEYGAFWDEILQHALGVATLTVAALESYANELYFEGSIISPVLNPIAAAEVTELIDEEKILKKYSVALAIRLGRTLPLGSTMVQNADALIKLRNAVVHFRPEWFGEQQKHDKLSKLLQYKFKASPWFSTESLFPRAWASHDFSIWALRSTVAFIEFFYAEVELKSPLTKFKPRLEELAGSAL